MCEVAMATDIDTPTLDNIAMVMDNMMGGSDHWRSWASVAVKDQCSAMMRDELAQEGLTWADSKCLVIGMDKAMAMMVNFSAHPSGYRHLIMTVDLLKEKAAEFEANLPDH
jgi:hypothetical protein